MGGAPTRRTGRNPKYIQYEGLRPAPREHAPDAAPSGQRLPATALDPVLEKLLGIAAPAATCHPERPLGDLPAALPGFYSNQLTVADQLTVPDPRPALHRTKDVPVLILRGSCDYKNPGIAQEYDDVLPNSTLRTIVDAGHIIDAEQPEVYREAVTSLVTAS